MSVSLSHTHTLTHSSLCRCRCARLFAAVTTYHRNNLRASKHGLVLVVDRYVIEDVDDGRKIVGLLMILNKSTHEERQTDSGAMVLPQDGRCISDALEKRTSSAKFHRVPPAPQQKEHEAENAANRAACV